MNSIAKGVDEKFCSECGTVIKVKAEICPACGVRQLPAPASVQAGGASGGRSRLAAALLAFFLGGLGIHRFYVGRNFSGFMYLIFCWTFIPAILAFIETFRFLLMSDATFQQKYPA